MSYAIEEVLRGKFLADETVAGMIEDRLYSAPAEHPQDLPYVVYQLISSVEGNELDGTPSLCTSRVQYSFISDDWKEARDILEEFRRVALDPALRGEWFGLVIDSVFVADKRDMGIDEDTVFFRHDLDLEVWQQLKS